MTQRSPALASWRMELGPKISEIRIAIWLQNDLAANKSQNNESQQQNFEDPYKFHLTVKNTFQSYIKHHLILLNSSNNQPNTHFQTLCV